MAFSSVALRDLKRAADTIQVLGTVKLAFSERVSPAAPQGNFGQTIIDFTELVGCKQDLRCTDVLDQMWILSCAGDRHYPGPLSHDPGQSELYRGYILAAGPVLDERQERHVDGQCIWLETPQVVTAIYFVEALARIDCPGEETTGYRAVGNKADTQLFQRRKNSRFRFSPPHSVFALNSGNGKYRMDSADGSGARFRQTPVLDLTCLDQFLDSTSYVLDRYVRIGAMLVEQIDVIAFQAFE